MDDNHTPLDARQRSREHLMRAARVTLSGGIFGWMAASTPIDPANLVAVGLMMILVPLDFLTASPIRLFVRIAGLSIAAFAAHKMISMGYLTASLAVLWLTIAAFAVNRDLMRQ